MTKDELDRLAALCEAATPGPWAWELTRDEIGNEYFTLWSNRKREWVIAPMYAHEIHPQSGDFITAARNALPALLDALDAAEAEIERQKALCATAARHMTRAFTESSVANRMIDFMADNGIYIHRANGDNTDGTPNPVAWCVRWVSGGMFQEEVHEYYGPTPREAIKAAMKGDDDGR